MSSIFSKIIDGEIPSHKVYEDEHTFVFMDIQPVSPAHVLVVPKVEVDRLEDLPSTEYIALMETVRKMMPAVREVTGKNRACMKVEGFDVPHAHVHVFPCDDAADFYRRPEVGKKPDHEALAAMATRLQATLQ